MESQKNTQREVHKSCTSLIWPIRIDTNYWDGSLTVQSMNKVSRGKRVSSRLNPGGRVRYVLLPTRKVTGDFREGAQTLLPWRSNWHQRQVTGTDGIIFVEPIPDTQTLQALISMVYPPHRWWKGLRWSDPRMYSTHTLHTLLSWESGLPTESQPLSQSLHLHTHFKTPTFTAIPHPYIVLH